METERGTALISWVRLGKTGTTMVFCRDVLFTSLGCTIISLSVLGKGDLPFNLARNPYYLRSYSFVVNNSLYPHMYWTPCVAHTLNLAFKNIYASKNTEDNEETFELCNWITNIHGDAIQIKNFIMNHTMRLTIFN
ncbi:hypothetical protein JHK82_016749 [Glycine max]|nr:hypothetical protein JHK82_016749 [Glycine max]